MKKARCHGDLSATVNGLRIKYKCVYDYLFVPITTSLAALLASATSTEHLSHDAVHLH